MAIKHSIKNGLITFREFGLSGSDNEAADCQEHSFQVVEDVWEDSCIRRICFWVRDLEIWTYRFKGLDLGHLTDGNGETSSPIELIEIAKSKVPCIDLAWRKSS